MRNSARSRVGEFYERWRRSAAVAVRACIVMSGKLGAEYALQLRQVYAYASL
jgi:hypothetical protein